MRLFRVHRRAIGVVASWLLVAHALVAGHMPMPQASIQDAALGEIVICTARGPVILKEGGELPVPSQHKPQCPCCMVGCLSGCAGGAVAVVAAVPSIAVVVAADDGTVVIPAAFEKPGTYLRLATSRPRAPPALIG
jgi:hypothetical protein